MVLAGAAETDADVDASVSGAALVSSATASSVAILVEWCCVCFADDECDGDRNAGDASMNRGERSNDEGVDPQAFEG